MEIEGAIREAFKQHKHKKCIELIEAASSDIRSSVKYKILKATCLNNIDGQSKRAHEVLDEVISVEPENAVAYYGKGLVFINEAKLEQAVQYFDEAMKLDPSEKMDKAREMKVRVLNMMSPERGHKKTANSKKSAGAKSQKPPHQCIECGKSFEQDYNLSRHMISHKGLPQFTCDVCPKSFYHKSDLSKHQVVHKNVGSFPCTVCLKVFKSEKNLESHAARHPTNINFKCNKCGKGFGTERSLSYHSRTHSFKKLMKAAQQEKESKSGETLQERGTGDLLEEVEIKDEFGEYEMEAGDEHKDVSSDDGILSSKSLTFGELEPITDDNSDWSFCVSLLNDMSKMNDDQKKDFRAKTQQTIKDILN